MSTNHPDPHVQLGEHSYAVYPQKIGYLENKLRSWTGRLAEAAATSDASNLVGMLGTQAYDVLRVFIPRLMDEHEFRGYRSAEAMEAGDYQADSDSSPDFPQIVEAFQVVMKVNRFDLFGALGKLVNGDMRQAMGALVIARMTEAGLPSPSESATTTPPTPSTPSGTTHLTSVASTD